MSNAKIGSLRVDLGVNTAAFQSGLDGAARKLSAFSSQMKKVGGKISGVGKSLTLGITAPVAAAGAAFSAAAHQMAADSREMAKSAQVAGESFEEFQRQAFAAKSVGIEFEKLGDIFKDMRDRVGDFVATGGGPMADFFENIAPKVGITADAFKGLSGKDALQLYFNSLKQANVSQEEMVFYLEAMASDATNLIPLLEQNGRAMGELGKNANVISDEERVNLEKYTKAQEQLGEALKKLTIALVSSGILETVTGLVERFAAFTSQLAETNPTLLKAGVVIGGVAAALGPVLIALGSLVSLAGPLAAAFGVIKIAALALMANPVILAFAAVVAGIYLAWQNWDKIGPIVARMYSAVKKWIVDKLGQVFNWLRRKVEAVTGFFADMYDAVVGNSYVPDMVDGIAGEMSRLQAVMVVPAKKAAEDTKAAMREMATDVSALLDRLFPEIARAQQMASEIGLLRRAERAGLISQNTRQEGIRRLQGFDQGPLEEAAKVKEATVEISAAMKRLGDKNEVQTVRIAQTFREMTDSIMASLRGFVDSIRSGDVLGILEGVIGIFTQLGSTGLFGKSIQRNLNSSIPQYAKGTNFHPGGLAIVGERGPELVNLNRGASVMTNRELRAANDGSRLHVTVGIDPANGNVTAFVNDQIAATAPAIVSAGSSVAQGQMAQRAQRRFR